MDGGHVSELLLLTWTTTNCAYLAQSVTFTNATDSVTNIVYLPPGALQARVGVSTTTAADIASVCITPAGAAATAGGNCPTVVAVPSSDPDASTPATIRVDCK
jgi:hypothetical protein